jgi:high-affinity iron transporter
MILIAALLLAFREGLEAALILGIVLSAVRRVGRPEQARVVWLGAGLAGFASVVVGLVLNALGVAFEGRAEKVFEGTAMLLAAAVLTWMIFWMARQGRVVQVQLEQSVHRATNGRGRWALLSVAFFAVLREGVELSLFLAAAAFTTTAGEALIGGLLGLAAAVVAGWLLFATTRRLNVRTFFLVTGILLILFAAGLVAHGIHEFSEAGWVPSVVEHVWDLNPMLNESSGLGQILTALVGYNADPSLTEVLAYAGYWLLVSLALLWPRLQTASLPGLLGERSR